MTKYQNIKIKLSALLLAVSFGFIPLAANAATLSLTPANIAITQGQSVTVTVTLNPQGSTIYSAKVEMNYPAEILQFTSFNFGSGWTHASADDVTDAAGGILRRTAGYPNPGLSSSATFGTVTFLAKSSGTGKVSVTAGSAVYDGSLQNTLTGIPVSAAVAVGALATPAPTSIPITGEVATPTPTPTPIPEIEEEEVEKEEVVVTEPEEGGGVFFAALGAIFTLGTDRALVAVLFVLAIIAAAYYLTDYFRRKKI